MKLVIQSEKVKSNLEVNRFEHFLLNEKLYWLGETKSDRKRQERTFNISLCNEMIYNDVNNSELAFFKTFFTFSMLLQLGEINFDF